MSAAVELFVPNAENMLAHLRHLFGGYLYGAEDGLIEIAWTNTYPGPDGKYKLNHAQHFETDQLEEAAQRAAEVNSNYLCNVYVSGALRKPGTIIHARAKDPDFYTSVAYWADLDSSDSVANALQNYADAKPTLLGLTGAHPDKRLQCWWKLTDRVDNPDRLRHALMGIACRMGSDTTVTNPARVMRLLGSIAWPHKPGRIAEMSQIIPLKTPGLREYDPEHLEQVFPPVISFAVAREKRDADGGDGSIVRAPILGMPIGRIVDGRKHYMMRVIEAVLISLVGPQGIIPTADELYDAAWPKYEIKVDLTRPGAGTNEFRSQCIHTIKRFTEGRIRGLKSIAEAQEAWTAKSAAQSAYTLNDWQQKARDYQAKSETSGEQPAGEKQEYGADPGPSSPPPPKWPGIHTSAEFMARFEPPDYLVDGLIQRRYIYSLTGATGHGKTAVALAVAACVATGKDLADKKVEQGKVLYLAGENPIDIMMRWDAMATSVGFSISDVPVYFVPGVFQIADLLTVISDGIKTLDGVNMVVIDTSAAYFLGDDENSNVQLGNHARMLRIFTTMQGSPCVIVNCHPIKNAGAENLLPRGGGAFLAEVDGNLTCTLDADVARLHWQGKFRGPEFDPVPFEIVPTTCPTLVDSKGRPLSTVVGRAITDVDATARRQAAYRDDDLVLIALLDDPDITIAGIVTYAGWLYKSRVSRALERLKRDGFAVKKPREKWKLTEAGKKQAEDARTPV